MIHSLEEIDEPVSRSLYREMSLGSRLLRCAERAGPAGIAVAHSQTRVAHAVLDGRAEALSSEMWEALMNAEGDSRRDDVLQSDGDEHDEEMNDENGATCVSHLSEPFDEESTATTVSNIDIDATDPNENVSAWPDGLPPSTVDDANPYAALQQLPDMIRQRSFAHTMPAPDRRRQGRCIVYWCLVARRVHSNAAFAAARRIAEMCQMPLLVLCSIGSLQGLADSLSDALRGLWLQCSAAELPVWICAGGGDAIARTLDACEAHICVTDEAYDAVLTRLKAACVDEMRAAQRRHCPLVAIDCQTALPLRYLDQTIDRDTFDRQWQTAMQLWRECDDDFWHLSPQWQPSVRSLLSAWLTRARATASQSVVIVDGDALPGAGFATGAAGEQSARQLLDALHETATNGDESQWSELLRALRRAVLFGTLSAVEVSLRAADTYMSARRATPLDSVVGATREWQLFCKWLQSRC